MLDHLYGNSAAQVLTPLLLFFFFFYIFHNSLLPLIGCAGSKENRRSGGDKASFLYLSKDHIRDLVFSLERDNQDADGASAISYNGGREKKKKKGDSLSQTAVDSSF